MATATAGEIWDLVKGLDDAIRDEDPSEWELNFIADMMDRRQGKRTYTAGQLEHILRLREKYVE